MHSKLTIKPAVVLFTAALSTLALAGPEFDEGSRDAGASASTSATVAASTNTAVTRVRGSTSSTALVAADPVDMFLVRTGANPYLFKIDMNMTTGGSPVWAARLTLFKKVVVDCGITTSFLVTIAVPVATVVKASSTVSYPILDGSALVVGSTTQKLGDVLVANSEYYVAVSGAQDFPMGIASTCSQGSEFPMFPSVTGTGIYLTNTTTTYRLSSWANPGTVGTGIYDMPTVGVWPLPASSCSANVAISGSPVEKLFDFSYAPTISGTFSCAAAQYNLTKEFFFEWTTTCTGTATVSTCGLNAADTGIEVYAIDGCTGNACAAAAGTAIACSDDACGYASVVTFPITSGTRYLIRLSRVWGTGTTGSIKFTCTAPTASADINGDGIVNGADLAIVLGLWGTAGN